MNVRSLEAEIAHRTQRMELEIAALSDSLTISREQTKRAFALVSEERAMVERLHDINEQLQRRVEQLEAELAVLYLT